MNSGLQDQMRGLSFAARAVLATATALTYELQLPDVPTASIMEILGLSEAAWDDAYAELYAAGALFDCQYAGTAPQVQTSTCFDILARAIGAGGRPSSRQWHELRCEIIEEYGAQCSYCRATDVELAIDHVLPVSRGGSNHPVNLVPACKRCNSAKGNKTWEEWYPEIARLRP